MTARKIALILFVSVAFAGCSRQHSSTTNVATVGSKMSRLIEEHHFQDAAQLGLRALTGKPSDAAIYYFVALSYAKQAQYEADSRESSLRLVDDYSRRSLSLDPDNQLNRFNIAWILENAGDVHSGSQCKFYDYSQAQLAEALTKLSGDADLKAQVLVSASRVSTKANAAHCKLVR